MLDVKFEFVFEVINVCFFLHKLCVGPSGARGWRRSRWPLQQSGDPVRNRLPAACVCSSCHYCHTYSGNSFLLLSIGKFIPLWGIFEPRSLSHALTSTEHEKALEVTRPFQRPQPHLGPNDPNTRNDFTTCCCKDRNCFPFLPFSINQVSAFQTAYFLLNTSSMGPSWEFVWFLSS